LIGVLLMSFTPMVSGQAAPPKAPAPAAPAPAPMPAPRMAAPAQAAPAPAPAAAPAQQPRQRIILEEPIRVFDPFFDYPYPYAYAPDYMAENFGYVKIETERKDASVYVDGGFADKIDKAKKFALRPGTHDIELRDSDGRKLFQERVAVLVGKTVKLHVG
jgi:hypothetical protein